MPDYDTIEEVKPEVKHEAVAEAPPVVPAGHEYDTPPKAFVPGTTYDPNTPVEDLTDPEWIQWAFDNLMPFWAIKKELILRNPPVVTALNPITAAIGDPSFTIYITGENFFAESVIVFAGQDEPTALNEDGTLSTGVNMDYWHGPDAVPVYVRNGSMKSEPMSFTFTAPAGEGLKASDKKAGKIEDPEHDPAYDHNDDDKAKHKSKSKK